jgi:cell shape-determining protein MreC
MHLYHQIATFLSQFPHLARILEQQPFNDLKTKKIARNVYKCYNSELGNVQNINEIINYTHHLRLKEFADPGSYNEVNMQLRLAKQETKLWKVAQWKSEKKNWRIIFNVLI